ncbi:MAG: type II toxin-antitoxin system HicB family antitoxin [SAR202 cluster bacterium]|nr:type II toxin-antitoxin system HicB family antitoxin [SAR202 cluster bacterium]
MKRQFLVVIEKANKNYSAYSPDLPGCIATGKTKVEVEQNMKEAVEMHIRGLQGDGLPVPHSSASAEYVSVGV